MMSASERDIDRLTTELCAFHRELLRVQNEQIETRQEALALHNDKRYVKKQVNRESKCFYCKGKGHFIKNCQKWIRDGRPQNQKSTKSEEAMTIGTIVSVTEGCDDDDSAWYVDNGATVHVTKDKSIFENFQSFNQCKEVKTAQGSLQAVGAGTVSVEMMINRKWQEKILKDVWYIQNI